MKGGRVCWMGTIMGGRRMYRKLKALSSRVRSTGWELLEMSIGWGQDFHREKDQRVYEDTPAKAHHASHRASESPPCTFLRYTSLTSHPQAPRSCCPRPSLPRKAVPERGVLSPKNILISLSTMGKRYFFSILQFTMVRD